MRPIHIIGCSWNPRNARLAEADDGGNPVLYNFANDRNISRTHYRVVPRPSQSYVLEIQRKPSIDDKEKMTGWSKMIVERSPDTLSSKEEDVDPWYPSLLAVISDALDKWKVIPPISLDPNRSITPPRFAISPCGPENDLTRALWFIVRDFEVPYHDHKRLRLGDIIRFGRLSFDVNLLQLEEDENSASEVSINLDATPSSGSSSSSSSCTSSELICRICLATESGAGDRIEDPLLHLCNCRGDGSLVHLSCIRLWLKEQSTKHRDEVSGAVLRTEWRNRYACELCSGLYPSHLSSEHLVAHKSDLPRTERVGQRWIGEVLFKPPLPCGPLLGLREHSTETIQFVRLTADGQRVFVGRGSDCELRLDDSSISRVHASFALEETPKSALESSDFNSSSRSVVLRDESSKYGTAVKIARPFPLRESEPIWFQAMNCVFMVQVESRFKLGRLGRSEIKRYTD